LVQIVEVVVIRIVEMLDEVWREVTPLVTIVAVTGQMVVDVTTLY